MLYLPLSKSLVPERKSTYKSLDQVLGNGTALIFLYTSQLLSSLRASTFYSGQLEVCQWLHFLLKDNRKVTLKRYFKKIFLENCIGALPLHCLFNRLTKGSNMRTVTSINKWEDDRLESKGEELFPSLWIPDTTFPTGCRNYFYNTKPLFCMEITAGILRSCIKMISLENTSPVHC